MRVIPASEMRYDPALAEATLERGAEGRATLTRSSGGRRREASLDPIVARVRAELVALATESQPAVVKYDPSQERDDHGRWTSGGGSPRVFTDAVEATNWANTHYINPRDSLGYWRTLSDRQMEACGMYSTYEYQVMNGLLRDGQAPVEVVIPKYDLRWPVTADRIQTARELTPVLQDVIEKAPPLREPLLTYRQFDASQFGDVQVGDLITDKGFISVATVPEVATMARPIAGVPIGDAEIVLPAGTHAGLISDYPELVLAAGSQFRVDSVEAVGPQRADGSRPLSYGINPARFRLTYLGPSQQNLGLIAKGTRTATDARFFWAAGDVIVTRGAALKYAPDQARDDHGRFTDGGGVPAAVVDAERANWRAPDEVTTFVGGPDDRVIAAIGGNNNRCDIPDRLVHSLAASPGAVMTHNHPRGWTFPPDDPRRAGNGPSSDDFHLAIVAQLGELRATTPAGVWSITPPDGRPHFDGRDLPAYATLVAKVNEVYSEQSRKVNWGELTPAQAEANHWNLVWERTADVTGVEATFTPYEGAP